MALFASSGADRHTKTNRHLIRETNMSNQVKNTKILSATILAGAVATVLSAGAMTALGTSGAQAAEMEKCYGVALKGQNDCKGRPRYKLCRHFHF